MLETNQSSIVSIQHHYMSSGRLVTALIIIVTLIFYYKINYNMSIMECLSPEGELLPGLATPVAFIFSPREAKTYTVSAAS